jgi:hypothetical protein
VTIVMALQPAIAAETMVGAGLQTPPLQVDVGPQRKPHIPQLSGSVMG